MAGDGGDPSSPQLAQITLFGEALQLGAAERSRYRRRWRWDVGSNANSRELLPESLELILNPLLTTIITGVVAVWRCNRLAAGFLLSLLPHGASGLSIAAVFWSVPCWQETFLPLVLTGLHRGFAPIHVELVQAHGYNALSDPGDGGRWANRCCDRGSDENPEMRG